MTLTDLANKVRTLWQEPGSHETEIPSLSAYRFAHGDMKMPNAGNPYLYLVVAGVLRLHTPSGIIDYMPGQCSASAIDTPDCGYILASSAEGDFIALSLTLTLDDVTSVMIRLDDEAAGSILRSSAPQEEMDAADAALVEVFERLVDSLTSNTRRKFLAEHLTEEAVFDMLMGTSGKQFLESAIRIRSSDDIYAANSWIKDNFRQPFSVEELAARWNMSPSNFHQKFKNAVGMGPLQCQKRLRLTEARRMMLDEGANVTGAAFAVGYESSSQFTRDYKKAFGATPSEDVKLLRAAMA